jgi:hypothetical protein
VYGAVCERAVGTVWRRRDVADQSQFRAGRGRRRRGCCGNQSRFRLRGPRRRGGGGSFGSSACSALLGGGAASFLKLSNVADCLAVGPAVAAFDAGDVVEEFFAFGVLVQHGAKDFHVIGGRAGADPVVAGAAEEAGRESGFIDAGALETPVGDFFKKEAFLSANGLELRFEFLFKTVEFRGVFAREDGGFGAETVLKAVQADGVASFGRSGASGFLRWRDWRQFEVVRT